MQRKAPVALTAIWPSQSASEVLASGAAAATPALLTSTSTAPISAKHCSTSASSATSQRAVVTFSAARAERFAERGERLLVAAEGEDPIAERGEGGGGGAADSLGTAGDDDGAAHEERLTGRETGTGDRVHPEIVYTQARRYVE